jgi:hypothetical protein
VRILFCGKVHGFCEPFRALCASAALGSPELCLFCVLVCLHVRDCPEVQSLEAEEVRLGPAAVAMGQDNPDSDPLCWGDVDLLISVASLICNEVGQSRCFSADLFESNSCATRRGSECRSSSGNGVGLSWLAISTSLLLKYA